MPCKAVARIKAGELFDARPTTSSSMITSLVGDHMCLGGELLTGKSIPILVGIVSLPIDRWLACIVVSMGAVSGALFSVFTSRGTSGLTSLGSGNRLIQQAFSLFLSLSLLLSISKGIHYDRGIVLSIVPSFCIALFALPQNRTPGILSFLLACVLLAVCSNTPVGVSTEYAFANENTRVLSGSRSAVPNTAREEAASVWQTVLRALQLFVLALYASLQHAPTQVYFGATGSDGAGDPHRHHPHLLSVAHHRHHHDYYYYYKAHDEIAFASPHHARDTNYAIIVGLTSALLRVVFWYIICFFPDNTMHVMLENDHSRGGWDWACCSLYITALLFSACWTATQITEQVLPHFGITSNVNRIRLVAGVLSLSTLYRQRDTDALFLATNVMLVLSIGTTVLTLK